MKILKYFLLLVLWVSGCSKYPSAIDVEGIVTYKEFNNENEVESDNPYLFFKIKDPRHKEEFKIKVYCVSSYDDVFSEGDMVRFFIGFQDRDSTGLATYYSWDECCERLKVEKVKSSGAK